MRPLRKPALALSLLLLLAPAAAPAAPRQDAPLVERPIPRPEARPRPRPLEQPPVRPGWMPQGGLPDRQSVIDLRRRLIELDRLLSLESLSRAESLLKDLEQHSQLTGELIPRRIKLAQLKGDHGQAVRLSREALAQQPRNPGLWRALATSLLVAGQRSDHGDSVRLALDRFIETSPNSGSAAIVGVELLRGAGWYAGSVALIDSMRVVLDQPRFLARSRALGLLRVDRQEEAAEEMAGELRISPYNLPLLRQSVLEGAYDPARHGKFLRRLIAESEQAGNQSSVRMLAANLLLEGGRTEKAVAQVAPLLEKPNLASLLLQNAVTLTDELPLLEDAKRRQAAVDYLLEVLGELAVSRGAGVAQNRRAADYLARACQEALELRALGDDPDQAVDRFAERLQLVRRVNPQAESLYSAQIKLAVYTRDVLREPDAAARRLERMLLDLDLPNQGVALVRLALGECYLAAGDTSRGRVVLTRLGRDPDFRDAGGHAHFHLARLDLAEGHFSTAQDRFAVVAIDHPTAPYANEALEMGLAIAEEMENPSGGPNILGLYAESVYYDLVDDPGRQVAKLRGFIDQATPLVDLDEPQHLLERGKYELAELYLEQDRTEDALTMFGRVVADHPDGRYAARSLVRRGEILAGQDRIPDARRELDLLLAQYPDYLFADDVRDLLRGWQ